VLTELCRAELEHRRAASEEPGACLVVDSLSSGRANEVSLKTKSSEKG
jgi:hypothetical protein